jgi:ABC-type methionine transport system ATPase subunit
LRKKAPLVNPEAEDILVANQISWRAPSDSGAQIHPFSHRFQRSSFYVVESDDAPAKRCWLRLFGLLDEPVSGEILLEGRRVTGLDSEELGEIRNRKLGFLFAAPFLLPSFTVLENVAMPLFKVAQVDAREAKSITETILDLVGISELVEVTASRLSPLQQHLTALARAIVHHPRLLVIEELGLGLDPEAALRVFDVARRIPERLGTTVIATLSAGVDFASGVVVLEIGAAGIREVRKEPRT